MEVNEFMEHEGQEKDRNYYRAVLMAMSSNPWMKTGFLIQADSARQIYANWPHKQTKKFPCIEPMNQRCK